MIDFRPFYQQLATSSLSHWLETLPLQMKQWQTQAHGDFEKWENALKHLPVKTASINLKDKVEAIESEPLLSQGERQRFIHNLKLLKPWRKGPYHLYDVHIDCEWRSDFKWDRVLPHLSPLKNRTILDVGCGSGYHMWRMVGEGAKLVVGIDPTDLFLCQFETVRKLLNNNRQAHLIPMGIEEMQPLKAFDTVFSMGVLYHRKSPFDHFLQLKNQLRNGGELVLETLVIDGGINDVLVPSDRYAKMRNVYFIPSVPALISWLEKAGFKNVRCVDEAVTTIEEQRRTEWIDTESLEYFLDPQDHSKTIEGYSAPKRAVIIANS
ncbi:MULTISPECIES: tRNA 5-methoxyuridine(34)/uridine 5-oxyacetic acid(34) synthase CmoB [Pasteurellaceae]|uniref:tRNA U34 carboxymethyltransferase n=1 Tax=Pasteurella atlantica TaxID=2827233 RepID=A0AAW8CMJ3_9PAST|nr:tRNA 5-methoxyuridine(34)/uridine 5-oxyacetic acid(34) synthase CmoB [Pasteurella atlantica]MBR0574304.1 tRNA 5-methoxyuridine(34)/uridine 5-oxyacetic acid(34) synthase CmoB [Pasteurella atlantica]MDP8040208.1 tRNA 5-methoxyuridine(34)/uridine 5-oxyacetic acid(34) synthase CmoB [Pasteurella atlantica]MDP8042353.1 tRNA 5-methoxyuridine(34)/uridine 5-oxyacetic acid(34) synthase CmoB [Pasteurella atlantica]MDP8044546.1 tRNA 5-methoxyuridine(34)/uridine 5-oxyacetic acid(34) synthase CmoB [Pasteu